MRSASLAFSSSVKNLAMGDCQASSRTLIQARPFGPVDRHEFSEVVDLLARKVDASLGVEGFDDAAFFDHTGKDLEPGRLHDVGDIGQFQPEAGVGFVQAVAVHGFGIGQPGKGKTQGPAQDFVEQAGHHAFADFHEVLFSHEGHLHVDLGELGLAIGPQVLVPKAAYDLVVAVESGDHQQLLEQLRGLGQGVELPGIDPAGNQVIPGAFGCAFGEHRCFDVEKSVGVEKISHRRAGFVPGDDVALQRRTAKVQVPVFQADGLGDVHLVLDQEGRRFGRIENFQFVHQHLDLTGGQRWD